VRDATESAFVEAPIGMALVDMAGQTLRVNDAFCRITGYTTDELLEMTVADVLHPDNLEVSLNRYRRRLHGEPMRDTYEIKLTRKDGSAITVFFMGALSMYYGRVATVGFVRDITLRKQLQESLYLSQRLAAFSGNGPGSNLAQAH
jgi:PAS domain S-box-containing protein